MARDLIVVPARYGSTRLPGKPLIKIAGRTLLSRVVKVARRTVDLLSDTDLLVATDDERIADWLAEIDHRPDENQPEATVIARIGEEAIVAWDRAGVTPDGWAVDSEARLAGWRALLAGARPVEKILLVTSNGAARFALAADTAVARAAAALPHRKLRMGVRHSRAPRNGLVADRGLGRASSIRPGPALRSAGCEIGAPPVMGADGTPVLCDAPRALHREEPCPKF